MAAMAAGMGAAGLPIRTAFTTQDAKMGMAAIPGVLETRQSGGS